MLESNVYEKPEVAEQSMGSHSNVAIAGINRMAGCLSEPEHYFNGQGETPVGVISIEGEDGEYAEKAGLTVLGNLENLKALVGEHQLGKLLLAIDPRDVNRLHYVISACEREKLQFELVSDLYDIKFGGLFAATIGGFFRNFEISIRRLFDLLVSTVLLVLFSPLLLVLAIIVKFDSAGPVFCSQEFVGKDGAYFRAYSFRTVVADMAKYRGLSIVTDFSPVRTVVGRFLKRTGLGDLPKLFTVFAGDLSMIGPEPERPYYHEKYTREVPFYANRLKVKPGIVGYAQVELINRYSIENIREKLKYDFYYVDHSASPLVNIKVAIKSLLNLVVRKSQ